MFLFNIYSICHFEINNPINTYCILLSKIICWARWLLRHHAYPVVAVYATVVSLGAIWKIWEADEHSSQAQNGRTVDLSPSFCLKKWFLFILILQQYERSIMPESCLRVRPETKIFFNLSFPTGTLWQGLQQTQRGDTSNDTVFINQFNLKI